MGSYSIACIKLRDYFFLEDTYYDIHTTFFTTGVCGLKIKKPERVDDFLIFNLLEACCDLGKLADHTAFHANSSYCLCVQQEQGYFKSRMSFPSRCSLLCITPVSQLQFHRSVISGDVKGLSDFKYVFLCCAFCAAMEGHAMDMQRTCSWSAFLKLHVILKAIEIL